MDYIKEFSLYLLGFGQGTRLRKLRDESDYLVREFTEEAKKEPDGVATIHMPFSWLPVFIRGPVTQITMVYNTDLIRAISTYGSDDPDSRLLFKIIESVTSGPNLISRHGPSVGPTRAQAKKVIHKFPFIQDVIQEELTSFFDKHEGKDIDLEKEFKKLGIRMVGRTTLGMHVYPPEEDFERMVDIIIKVDEGINTFNKELISEYEEKLKAYSEWMYEHNKETIMGENSFAQHFLGENIRPDNVASVFIATPNIVKLTYATLIFLSCNPVWQEKLREALLMGDTTFIRNFYKEACRHFVVTSLPRFASKETHFKGYTFPAGTFFFLPTRHLRMDPDIYPNPKEFNPNRFLEKDIKMNSVELAPFGLGSRQCIASGQYTEKFWGWVMEFILHPTKGRNYRIVGEQERMEDIPVGISHFQLKEKYTARFTSMHLED